MRTGPSLVITRIFLALAIATSAIWIISHRRSYSYIHYFHVSTRVDFGCVALIQGGIQLALCRDWPWADNAAGWGTFSIDPTDGFQLMQDNKTRSDARFAGFRIIRGNAAWPIKSYSPFVSIRIPLWFFATLFLTAAARKHFPSLKKHHRLTTGRCPACGYDRRATPNRCPECGLGH